MNVGRLREKITITRRTPNNEARPMAELLMAHITYWTRNELAPREDD